MDFSKARTPRDVLDLMSAGVRTANDEAKLCSRKLRIALKCLEVLAMPAGEQSNLESAMEKMMREAAQTALDRIGELK